MEENLRELLNFMDKTDVPHSWVRDVVAESLSSNCHSTPEDDERDGDGKYRCIEGVQSTDFTRSSLCAAQADTRDECGVSDEDTDSH